MAKKGEQKGMCLRCKKVFKRKSASPNNVFFFDCKQHGGVN